MIGFVLWLYLHSASVQAYQCPCPEYYTKGNGTCVLPLDTKSEVFFKEDGTPYQCGPMSYYGAFCWIPKGIPKSSHQVKGYLWALIPETLPVGAAETRGK